METVYTFEVRGVRDWGKLFTMDIELDVDGVTAQKIADGKADDAMEQCYPYLHKEGVKIEARLKNVHVKE